MDVDAALRSQIRNIEATYGQPLDHWFTVIDASGLTKHNEVVAMVQPSTTGRIDLGLILPAATPAVGRLEPAAGFNALFTHRVRITAATDLDNELRGWLTAAYTLAG